MFSEGVRWLEGTHAWVASWRDGMGEKTEHAYVVPYVIRSGQKVPMEEMWHGILIQLGWIVALSVILAIAWKLGTRKYEGWGG